MNKINNKQLSFNGTLTLKTFRRGGAKAIVEEFSTSKVQDELIKIVADGISPNGAIANRLPKEKANAFNNLIEMIIGKKMKNTRQDKLMTNAYSRGLQYGDCYATEKGGIYLDINFNK